jgi:polysaccharide export outer membrane protein
MFHLRSHEVLSPNSELLSSTQYYLSQGDEISVKVYSNDGEKLLEPLAVNGQALSGDMISYTIESDGKANLPILGYIYLAGYTTREADSLLVIEYSKTIIEPYVQVRVLNKRAYVFPGGGESRAMVIPLENDQTSLVEALALAGGINNGKAQKIKLIRRSGNTSKIYMIDLSEYDEAQYASLVLQANDLIYVTPQNRFSRKILEEVGPYLSLISTFAIIYNITAP